MLVPFVVDADSLADQEWSAATLRSHHQQLLDTWRRIGWLVHDGAAYEGSRLQAAINALPQAIRSRWQELLGHLAISAAGEAWNGCVGPKNVDEIGRHAQVALLDDLHALCNFDFREDEDQRVVTLEGATPIDVCRLGYSSNATPFQRALAYADRHIEAGETYQEIWRKRFHGLAVAPLKQVALVDRYAVEQHYECPQSRLSGLARFMKLLDADSGTVRYVTIHSAWTDRLYGKSLDEISASLRESMQHMPHHNIKRVTLIMSRNAAFSEMAHDRFVRFGNYVWDLGLGLQVFEGPTAGQRSQAAFKCTLMAPEYRDIEDELRRSAGTKEQRVFP